MSNGEMERWCRWEMGVRLEEVCGDNGKRWWRWKMGGEMVEEVYGGNGRWEVSVC